MTNEQLIASPYQKIARSIIINQLALNANEDLLFSAPELYRQKLKYAFKNYIAELRNAEVDFDMLFDKQESASVDTYAAVENFMETVSKIPVHEMENASAVLEAFLKDPKSIEGITNKILKYK